MRISIAVGTVRRHAGCRGCLGWATRAASRRERRSAWRRTRRSCRWRGRRRRGCKWIGIPERHRWRRHVCLRCRGLRGEGSRWGLHCRRLRCGGSWSHCRRLRRHRSRFRSDRRLGRLHRYRLGRGRGWFRHHWSRLRRKSRCWRGCSRFRRLRLNGARRWCKRNRLGRLNGAGSHRRWRWRWRSDWRRFGQRLRRARNGSASNCPSLSKSYSEAVISKRTGDLFRNLHLPLRLTARKQRRIDLRKNFVKRQCNLESVTIRLR